MSKNEVKVFLRKPEGDEEILLSGIKARKVPVKKDEKLQPCILINRSNHPEYYIYDSEKRSISPRAELKLGDSSKLSQCSLENKNLILKKLVK